MEVAHDRGGTPLVRRVAIGVQEADGDRLHAVGDERAGRARDRLLVERGDDRAVARHALGNLEAAAARNERGREGKEQVIDVVALLDAQLEHVAHAHGGEQAERRAAPFDQRIGDERRSVDDLVHLVETDFLRFGQLGKSGEGSDGGIRGGQVLVQADAAVARVEQHEVGECAADINPDPISAAHQPNLSSSTPGTHITDIQSGAIVGECHYKRSASQKSLRRLLHRVKAFGCRPSAHAALSLSGPASETLHRSGSHLDRFALCA